MNRLTERVNYGSSWVETVETDGYIPLNYSTGTTTGKCVDKLGNIEDIFELIEEMHKNLVCWRSADGKELYEDYTCSTILYNPKTNEIEIYYYEFATSYKVEEYGVTWWIKEDKTE